ncbi:hypothetical protein NPIL_181071 [Nephila pilipes]|uniref:Secreted protein n=1 Tax=Nephila pilipes TaxID=299642 RepID=A0A8X6I921_NEPPI|nr:hypothetical protein NPIL_181071 [Nephila pilipes]
MLFLSIRLLVITGRSISESSDPTIFLRTRSRDLSTLGQPTWTGNAEQEAPSLWNADHAFRSFEYPSNRGNINLNSLRTFLDDLILLRTRPFRRREGLVRT